MPGDKRETMLTVRLTEDEHEQLKSEAKEEGVYLSELARNRMVGGEQAGEEPQRIRWKLAREAVSRFMAIDDLPLEELWLYGSVARGDAMPDSDIDFLVVLDIEKDQRREWRRRLFERVMDLEWEHHVHFSLQIHTPEMWETQKTTAYGGEVRRDGIRFEKQDDQTITRTSAA